MGVALYRKYRSKSLGELVGQSHITDTLERALKNGAISHAYLFTGPRGTGKTSVARILAHQVNDLAYDESATHLDIIEIDAASNRRIDEIRDLRDRVHIAPTSAKYKVYIIDEVHMLTREAFNALLKTLEEPPTHVIFILATTEFHKLPETIVSRTQRHTFKPVETAAVFEHLRTIAKAEGIQITDDALQLVAEHGQGSFRDSISLLDQVSSLASSVTQVDVQQALGVAPAATVEDIITAVATADLMTLASVLKDARHRGYQPSQLANQLAEVLRAQLIEQSDTAVLPLLNKLLTVQASPDPAASLELALIGHALSAAEKPLKQVAPKQTKAETQTKERPTEEPTKPPQKPTQPEQKVDDDISTPSTQASIQPEVSTDVIWAEVLRVAKARHNTLYSFLRMATPEFAAETLTLAVQFPFHQKRLSEAKNTQAISEILAASGGKPDTEVIIITRENKPAAEPELTQAAEDNAPPQPTTDEMKNVSNIFGGAEVLE